MTRTMMISGDTGDADEQERLYEEDGDDQYADGEERLYEEEVYDGEGYDAEDAVGGVDG